MSLSKWNTRYATLVCLAPCNKVTHTTCELFIVFDQPAKIGCNECAVDTSHIHFSILMNSYGTWNRSKDL